MELKDKLRKKLRKQQDKAIRSERHAYICRKLRSLLEARQPLAASYGEIGEDPSSRTAMSANTGAVSGRTRRSNMLASPSTHESNVAYPHMASNGATSGATNSAAQIKVPASTNTPAAASRHAPRGPSRGPVIRDTVNDLETVFRDDTAYFVLRCPTCPVMQVLTSGRLVRAQRNHIFAA